MNPSLYFYPLAPAAGSMTREPEYLSGTGTTEAHSATRFSLHKNASLQVGAVPIRIVWHSTAGSGDRVATTSLRLPADGLFTWTVTGADTFISIEAGDGSAEYEAWLWQSSP